MWQMTLAGARMFLRNRGNLFWSFVLPVIMMVIFGAVFGSQTQTVAVGIWNRSDSAPAAAVVRQLRHIPAFHVTAVAGWSAVAQN